MRSIEFFLNNDKRFQDAIPEKFIIDALGEHYNIDDSEELIHKISESSNVSRDSLRSVLDSNRQLPNKSFKRIFNFYANVYNKVHKDKKFLDLAKVNRTRKDGKIQRAKKAYHKAMSEVNNLNI